MGQLLSSMRSCFASHLLVFLLSYRESISLRA